MNIFVENWKGNRVKHTEFLKDINQTPFEIQSVILLIKYLYPIHKRKWDLLSTFNLIQLDSVLYTTFKSIIKNEDFYKYQKSLFKRMEQDHILGKRMKIIKAEDFNIFFK